MFLSVTLLLIVFANDSCVNSAKNHRFNKQTNNNTSLQQLSKLYNEDNLAFCEVGCVLDDPKNRPRIDDPGRNIYDGFSVISSSYVVEVIGSYDGLDGYPLRVMVSERILSRNFKTSIELEQLRLFNGELIQRITFSLNTEFVITRHSGRSGGFSVSIPRVVPHVLLVYDCTLELAEEKVTGVVSVEVTDYPRTLEVQLVRDDDGRCRVKPLDEREFKDYMVSVKVRGENRHVIGAVGAIVHDKLIENGFPFEAYMSQLNEFTVRLLKEAILNKAEFIKKNKMLHDLCETISQKPSRPHPNPDSSSSEESSSSKEDSSCEDNCCRKRCKCKRCKCKDPCKDSRTHIKIKIKD